MDGVISLAGGIGGPPHGNILLIPGGTGGAPVIKITHEGMFYRDVLIEDAGEAHRLMLEFLRGSVAILRGDAQFKRGDAQLSAAVDAAIETRRFKPEPADGAAIDLVERLAREASPIGWRYLMDHEEALTRFAALVAEECAKVAEATPTALTLSSSEACAAAIRAKFKGPA